ncbi:MAG: hypothetical protein CMI02_05975 [Oceanospirillaceae bacterium]|mgnify:FL=1|nr:hypothetical protein [Oceanospirillaceae bacterium]MBT11564.1 hypothetical protein [Oceanospirillaceae bacterium]|tara:strand:+ start:10026 stop:10475 length:450 start_codon:yes stop_codon:yes gene_type:complete
MKTLIISLFALLSAFSLPAVADRGEQKQVFGDYEIHYMGLNSSFLEPEVAEAYGIPRSRSMGYLSISIMKTTTDEDVPEALTGDVRGQMQNMIGQKKELEFKEIKERNAIYYISTFRFDQEDVYKFTLQVSPDGESRTFDVKFDQRFYD